MAGAPAVEIVPEGLTAQLPLIRHMLRLAGIAVVGAPRHEADDVVGTYASRAELPVDVVTGDRDLFQLIDDSRHARVIGTARWHGEPGTRHGPDGRGEGLLAAASDAASGLSAPTRPKLAAAAAYLAVAPAVVKVVRDLALPTLEGAGAQLRPIVGDARAELEGLATAWNLGGSVMPAPPGVRPAPLRGNVRLV